MAKTASLQPKNSTIGRIKMTALRRAIGLYGGVRPAALHRLLADWWSSPVRRALPSEPEGKGLAGHRFDLTVAGRKLAAWDFGSGPTVLLAHGWNGHAGQLSPLIAPLVESGHYVITFDQPAHARSEGRLATLAEMSDAVVAIGKRVGPVRAVVGHSLGGAAAAIALKKGLHADRLVLIAPPARVTPYLEGFASRLGLSDRHRAGLIAEIARRVGPIAEFEVPRVPRERQAPLLVVHDAADREVPIAQGREIAEAWADGRLEVVNGLGHRRLLADREVIRKVVEFVTSDRQSLARSA